MKQQSVYLVKIMEIKYFLRMAGTVPIFNVAKPQKRIKNRQGLAAKRVVTVRYRARKSAKTS